MIIIPLRMTLPWPPYTPSCLPIRVAVKPGKVTQLRMPCILPRHPPRGLPDERSLCGECGLTIGRDMSKRVPVDCPAIPGSQISFGCRGLSSTWVDSRGNRDVGTRTHCESFLFSPYATWRGLARLAFLSGQAAKACPGRLPTYQSLGREPPSSYGIRPSRWRYDMHVTLPQNHSGPCNFSALNSWFLES